MLHEYFFITVLHKYYILKVYYRLYHFIHFLLGTIFIIKPTVTASYIKSIEIFIEYEIRYYYYKSLYT